MKYIRELIEATILAAIFALPFIVYLYNMAP
jgi:hypothetical protein